jgi:hypothetical protein
MRGIVRGMLATAVTTAAWFVVAQTNPASRERPNVPSSAGQTDPVLSVSPTHLDFGLVGVGRSKQFSFTVQNKGSGMVTGVATVTKPFALSANAYMLEKGQSQTVSVYYAPTAEGTNSAAITFSGITNLSILVSGRARTPPRPPGKPKVVSQAPTHFTEEDATDVAIRYYSDTTSYILKPAMMDGPYRSVCSRARALDVAARQPRHHLAVVVLIHYPGAETEEPIKQQWRTELKTLGYERIVFLRGTNKLRINGLPILKDE